MLHKWSSMREANEKTPERKREEVVQIMALGLSWRPLRPATQPWFENSEQSLMVYSGCSPEALTLARYVSSGHQLQSWKRCSSLLDKCDTGVLSTVYHYCGHFLNVWLNYSINKIFPTYLWVTCLFLNVGVHFSVDYTHFFLLNWIIRLNFVTFWEDGE